MASISILACSTTAASHTGDTAETTLATYTLLANTLPANAILRITTKWTRNISGSSNNIDRIRVGGTTGTIYGTFTKSTALKDLVGLTHIFTDNATNAQKGLGSAAINQPYSASSTAQITSALDTTSNVDIVFSAQLANSGDSDTLESYIIEMIEA